MVAQCHLTLHALDYRVVPDKRVLENGLRDFRVRTDDRVTDLGAIEHRTSTDRDVGPDLRLLQRDVVFDIDRIDDGRVANVLRATRAPAFEHRLVGLDHRLDLSRVVPAFDIDDLDLGAFVDHVLERIGEKVFPLILRLLENVFDSLEQQLPVPHVVEPDVGTPRNRSLRLLDDLRHVAVFVGDNDSEPLVVLNFLDPDDSVCVHALHLGQIRIEDRIHENDEDGLVHVVARERDRPRRAVLHFLLNEHGRHVDLRARVLLDLLLEMTRDVNDLLDIAQILELVEDVRHHRLAGDLHHRLGREVRVRTKPGALARQRDDHFHGSVVPSRPYLSLRRTMSSTSGVDTSSTSQSVTAII